jgi:hypothetical protein
MPAVVTQYTDPFKIAEVMLATITFLIVISYIFKDSSAYRMLSHLLLGAATAVTVAILYRNVLRPNWWLPMSQGFASVGAGKWDWKVLWLLCLVPGAMWYTLYFKKLEWMSRIIFGLFIGMGAGLAFKNYLLLIVPQITNSFKPIVALTEGGRVDVATSINNVLFLATLVTILVYFFFTFRMEVPLVNRARGYGRWMMMICFGTLFGFTVMTRMSYFLERLRYVKIELLQRVLGL